MGQLGLQFVERGRAGNHSWNVGFRTDKHPLRWAASTRTLAAEAVPALTTDQMREVDRVMIEDLHIELIQMMENAGRGPRPSALPSTRWGTRGTTGQAVRRTCASASPATPRGSSLAREATMVAPRCGHPQRSAEDD